MNHRDNGNFLWNIWGMIQRAAGVFLSKKTPWYVRIVLGAGLLYVLSPYDLIPEWVPVLGIMDDLALTVLLITWAAGYSDT